MAWYPRAVRKQLTVPRRAVPNEPLAMPSPRRINLHTAVSASGSLAWSGDTSSPSGRMGYFNTTGAGGVFSHFYVREDGRVEQMQDTAYRSSCDLDGNPDTISIESWDGAAMVPWTPVQVAAIVDLLRWIWSAHPSVPRQLARDNRKGSTSWGLSWHQLGVPYDKRAGYAQYTQAEGGLYYTTSRGKECPGKPRIGQIPGIYSAAVGGGSIEEDDMGTPAENADYLLNQTTYGARGTLGEMLKVIYDKSASADDTVRELLGSTYGKQGTLSEMFQRMDQLTAQQSGQIAGLIEALKQVGGGSVDLASVEAAAKRGAQEALRGATVSVDLGGGAA